MAMEFVGRAVPEVLEFMMTEGGFGSVVLLLVAVLFIGLFWAERRRNQTLITMIVKGTKEDTGKYVEVVTSSSEAMITLAQGIEELTRIMHELRLKMDALAATRGDPSGR